MPLNPSTNLGEDHLFDAVKLVGTANSSGLFGAGVAIYYFAARSPEIAHLLKLTAFIYFAGVFLFAFSYANFASFFINQEPSLSGLPDYVPGTWRYITGVVLAACSFVAWIIGSCAAAYVIYKL